MKSNEPGNADPNLAIVFDLETTGLESEHDAIIEIGAVPIVDGRVREDCAFHSLVDPDRSFECDPSFAIASHGGPIRDFARPPCISTPSGSMPTRATCARMPAL